MIRSAPVGRAGPRRRAALLLILLPLAFAPPLLWGAEEPLRIGRITIRVDNVFSAEEAARGWVYRAADVVHVPTRASVIRRFLLFGPGDPYVPARLAQTERNLRALPFIKTASVTAGPPHAGVVDVEVLTQDSWTLQPGISLGGHGGTTTYGFQLDEKNVFGTGKALSISYDRGTERINRLVEYKDPYLFGPYWLGQASYSLNSDGREQGGLIARPFVSFTDPWSVKASYDNLQRKNRIFQNGVALSRYEQDHRDLLVQYGRAVAATELRARRLSIGYQSIDDRFRGLPQGPVGPVPDPRRFRYLFLQYEDVENDFLKINFVNRDSRYEDFNLGSRLAFRAAVSLKALGAPETTGFLRVEGSRGMPLGPGSFLLGEIRLETRVEAGSLRNAILGAQVRYVRKFDTALLQTLVSRLEISRGWGLDRDVQFFVDGETGLRAYRLHAFEGNKRILWNVEHRVFSGKEILQLVSPGLAIFFDTGAAAPPGESLRLSDFKSDVGVGLRFGIARASANNSVLRLDLAYALNPDPGGRRGFLVTFSSGQAF